MHIVKLIIIAAVLSIMSSVTAGMANDRATSQANIEKTILEIDQFLKPYKQKSLNRGLGERISPFDLPSSPANWHSEQTSPPQSFPARIRLLIMAGVCHGNTAALRKIFELEWLVYGLAFNEAEVLFLQRYSTSKGIDLPFHQRYRKLKNYTSAMAETPQRLMSINVSFDKQKTAQARRLVRSFKKICPN